MTTVEWNELDVFNNKDSENILEEIKMIYNTNLWAFTQQDLHDLVNLESEISVLINKQKNHIAREKMTLDDIKNKKDSLEKERQLYYSEEKEMRKLANWTEKEYNKYNELQVRAKAKEDIKEDEEKVLSKQKDLLALQEVYDNMWLCKNYLDRMFWVIDWELRREERLK